MPIPVIFEDDHFIVAEKPAGIATHASAPGQIAFVEQLSEQTGLNLGVHQRLDAATSGVIAFSKTQQGAQRLQKAFELRNVKKTYRALVCGIPDAPSGQWVHYLAHKDGLTIEAESGKLSKSRYRIIKSFGPFTLLELDLLTGMTHQLRVQCALAGYPILGDTLYGGGDLFPRLCLHAHKLRLLSEPNLPTFQAPLPEILDRPSLNKIVRPILTAAMAQYAPIPDTEAIRLLTPQHSGIPELIIEKLAQILLIRHLEPDTQSLWTTSSLNEFIETVRRSFGCSQFCYRVHESPATKHPCRAFTKAFAQTPDPFTATENDIRFGFDLSGNATGLYLDQRSNRAWIREHARGNVLNLFAYTCAFSVCAAKSPAVTATTSIDAASAALRRGRSNFELNDISLDGHRFITEDVFKYLNRCIQNHTQFDTVICDPPSFGRFEKITFSLDESLEKLIEACLQVAAPNAVLLFSINHRKIRINRLKSAWKQALQKTNKSAKSVDIFINDDATGPLGVGTDLKTIRAEII
ncbi:MAG: class I SAM-dependent methyltransferase [Proteobacteria bacterium]|nr:class I SAM-dependent methyltransferase [Pseudomonadota bacterium]